MKAVILNDFLFLRGGGERSTLSFALALRNLGYDVEIVSRNAIPPNKRLTDFFGEEFSDISLQKVSKFLLYHRLKRRCIDLFVNHSHQDTTRNPARFGIYVQMFPRKKMHRNLRSYQLLSNISEFTKLHTDRFWNYPQSQSVVLHPPISSPKAHPSLPRQKVFLNVGRFLDSPKAHNKNQLLLAEAFLEARASAACLSDWKLILVGSILDTPASLTYVGKVRALAALSSGSIELRHDLTQSELQKLMSQSFAYVHAAGAFHHSEDNAFRCEHYGFTILEAMAAGCYPLIFYRGGALELMKAGQTYRDKKGLVTSLRAVAELFEVDLSVERRQNSQALEKLSLENFTQGLQQLILQFRKS